MAYITNFRKIYSWQAVGILAGFASLFLVTPAISSDKQVYGVYSLCVSLMIFLTYADLGFLGAGFKFAAEAYARHDREQEVRIVGFVVFVFGLLSLVFIVAVVLLSIWPTLVFPRLVDPLGLRIASRLLLILAAATVNSVWQRALQLILGVRLEDYVLRRFTVAASLTSVVSILWFFRPGSHDIVGYFLFVQGTGLLASAGVTAVIAKRTDFSLRAFFRALRFDREIFDITKGLAVTGLLGIAGWVIYYELDLLFISTRIGVSGLALYSACLTIINFVRSLLGALYAPFQARFNHFIGTGDLPGLRTYYEKVIILTRPVILLSVCALFVLMGPFIVSWLGPGYRESVSVGRLLICIYLLAYFQYPAGVLLSAQKRLREINAITVLNIIVFWTGVLLTYRKLGIEALALFKLATFLISGSYYALVSFRFLRRRPVEFLWGSYSGILLPVVTLGLLLHFATPLFAPMKSKVVMSEVAAAGIVAASVAYILFVLASRQYRTLLQPLIFGKLRNGTQR